jgi:uncharacterized RDD family membrane protein YckC
MSISIGASDTFAGGPAVSEEATRVSGRRFVAHFVDGLLYSVVALVAVIALIALVAALGESTAVMVAYVAGLVAILTVGHVWFLVLLHKGDGQSPGKRVAGIKVVDAEGRVPSTSALWKRFWPVIIEYFYVIAWIGMMTSSHRQRFGDRIADTYVVEA